MDHESFTLLLSKLEPMITRQDTIMRQAVSAAERLAVTLRFLATGKRKRDLSHGRRGSAFNAALLGYVYSK